MRKSLLILLIALTVTSAMGQDSDTLRSPVPDSTVALIHGFPTSTTNSPHQQWVFPNLSNRSLYAGVSFLNGMRSQIPNAYIDPLLKANGISWRFSNPVIVIDGLPVRADDMDIFNLNAFEYGDIRTYQSRNAGTLVGTPGYGGVIQLTSRTGEGVTGPSFEINSSTGYRYSEETKNLYPTSGEQWMLSNSVAYSQDFGAIDTRVSVSSLIQPGTATAASGPDRLNVKLNTGFRVNRLSLRLVLDQTTTDKASLDQQFIAPFRRAFLQGNLTASYEVNSWLTASAQLASGDIGYDRFHKGRDQVLAAVSGKWQVLNGLTVGLSTGWQYQKNKSDFYITGAPSEVNSLLGSLDLSYRGLASINTTVRSEHGSLTPRQTSGSIGGALFLNRVLQLPSSGISQLKLRASAGVNATTADYLFPTQLDYTSAFSLSNRPVQSYEGGVDAVLFDDRLSLTLGGYSYEQDYGPDFLIDPATGFIIYFPEFNRRIVNNGFEARAIVRVARTDAMTFDSGITWSNAIARIENRYNTSIQPLSSAFPDWTSGWFNTIRMGGWEIVLLADYLSGGKSFYDGNSHDASFFKLREIGIGYTLPSGPWKSAQVSLSGRNLVRFSTDNEDVEIGQGQNLIQKSVCLSFQVKL